MASFSFRAKPPKKAKAPKPVVQLTEEEMSESNPDLLTIKEHALEDKAKKRLREENALVKLKNKDFNQLYYNICLVFQSDEQKLEFLSHFEDVLCIDETFIDGETFAEKLGVKITPNQLPAVKTGINEKFAELAKIPRE